MPSTVRPTLARTRRRRHLLPFLLAPAAALALVLFGGADSAHADKDANAERYQKLLDKADAIAAEVAKLRGLALKRPIKRGVMQKDEIEKRLLQRLDEEYSASELAAEELMMKRLALLPEDADYKKMVLDLLTEQIAGFYDPVDRKLYIAGWQTGGFGGEDMLMAHEIDHALQDQHFELRVFMKPDKQNSDASAARQALVEGDGTALMIEYAMAQVNMPPPWHQSNLAKMLGPQMASAMGTGALGDVPLFLREGLVFPYFGGLMFVAHFRKTHPWKRIDAMYRKPPLSTEQILHPERYELYERPDEVTAAPLPALRGYKQIYANVTGELGLALLLRQHMIEPRTGNKPRNPDPLRAKIDQAVAGWGGDRIALYAPPEHDGSLKGVIGVSYLVWDQEADAMEFFDILADAMPVLSGGKVLETRDGYVSYRESNSGTVYIIQRRKDAVVMLLGASADNADTVMSQIWKRWCVRRR